MDESVVEQLSGLFRTMADDPPAAALRLREMADRLLVLAEMLEQQQPGGTRDQGGTVDRAVVQVVGPDGRVRQSVDTAARN